MGRKYLKFEDLPIVNRIKICILMNYSFKLIFGLTSVFTAILYYFICFYVHVKYCNSYNIIPRLPCILNITNTLKVHIVKSRNTCIFYLEYYKLLRIQYKQ